MNYAQCSLQLETLSHHFLTLKFEIWADLNGHSIAMDSNRSRNILMDVKLNVKVFQNLCADFIEYLLQFTQTPYGLFIYDSPLTSLWCHCFIITSHSSTLLHSDVMVTSLLHFDIITPCVLLVYKQLDTCLYFPSLVLLIYTWVLAKASHPLSLILRDSLQDNSLSWSWNKCDQPSLSQVLWATISALLSFVNLVTLVVHKQGLYSLSGREIPCHSVAHWF